MTQAPAIHFPKVPDDLSSIVKPEELVDIVEMTPLTLQDRRIYNLLLGNAWNDIFNEERHTISRKLLTKHVESNNQDIAASLRRLMSAIVQIRIRRNRNGEAAVRQVALLGSNEIESRGAHVSYAFPPELVKIIKDTQIFARLHTQVMFQLSSKYSLALYEFLQRRKNLQYIDYEVMPVAEVRGLLGVPVKKLKSFGHFNKYALQAAAAEVSYLTEYEIQAEPVRTGRNVTHIRFAWKRKTDLGAQIEAVEELERSKAGRKARMQGRVETVESDMGDAFDVLTSSQKTDFSLLISADAMELARKLAYDAGTGWDIYAIESQFVEYAQKKGLPDNPDGAFIGFVRNKVKKAP